MRTQSDATKLRYAKRELRLLRDELAKRRIVGGQMANVCFNLGQAHGAIRKLSPACDQAADAMWELHQEWDAIQRCENALLRSMQGR